MRTHGRALQTVQWCVVAAYVVLVAVPAFLPLPPEDAHGYDNLVVAAQWMFWGLWWPLVIASMFVLGRTWCGVFCPEGTLSEAASRHGLGRGVPRWLRWGGWPFVAFALTTVFGQLVSVYQYATATLLVLGGSTLAAVAVGFVYGKGKRVWCRHLCPVNGVFAVLARMSPLHFAVDTGAWRANAGRVRAHPVNCAPMVRIRRMTGASECHMCARCSGLHGAVALDARLPGHEVARIDVAEARAWDAVLIVFGMMGLAIGAFEWSATPWFVDLRTALANHVLEHGPAWLLADNAPWWLLTHYPDVHDVFTWLDGALIVGWIVGTALVLGGFITLCLALASLPAREIRRRVYALSYALTPLAGIGLFVGLSALTVGLAKGEGVTVHALPMIRCVLLAAGAAWSVRLGYVQLKTRVAGVRLAFAIFALSLGIAGVLAAWYPFVFRIA
ncbi:MAG TPA: 4Fe-4S binding protein [Casimicrobiaceae bacterium]|nr:4Fe-4S binding protein [Casimicrobiaceae bacterium]